MNLPTKRIITVTAEYNFPNDPELVTTLTDKNIVEKNDYRSDFKCLY